ncbi:hypothetical protein [Cellulomonas persica]|uniref:hypothetical protein n=1 Tax=Cellulomonas persica TaxID=76861 RepID=UPI0011BED923|nr:hypothetical protein [Cellulomonas persica]
MGRAGEARNRVHLEHPVTLLLASGAAIVGIVLLLVTLVTLGTRSLEASNSGDVPCLVAVSDEVAGASVDNHVLPPRTTCTWRTDAGATETVVVAEPSAAVFWTGAVLFFGGIATCVGVLVAPRLRR